MFSRPRRGLVVGSHRSTKKPSQQQQQPDDDDESPALAAASERCKPALSCPEPAQRFMQDNCFLEERCWRNFMSQSKMDLNLDSRKKLKLVMQGWCTCLFQTCFTLIISIIFIESRTKFADDFHMTTRFAGMELAAEEQVVDGNTFFDYVHAMERNMLKTSFNASRTDVCAQLFADLCVWGTNNGLNQSIVDGIIEQNCWNVNEHSGYIDGNNRLLFATHVTQRRRAQVDCQYAIDIVDPYPESRECLDDTEEDAVFEITSGPCTPQAGEGPVVGSLDDCRRFGAWTYNVLAQGYVVTFSEPSYGFPGYSECRMKEIQRLHWADRRTKQLCYLFHVMNKDNNKILRFSNCFSFGNGGDVSKEKVISIVNIVSDEYFAYAYSLCIVGIFLPLFRALAETLCFFKEAYFGTHSRERDMFIGILRDLSYNPVQCARSRYRIFGEGIVIWLSSILFVVYFVNHMSFLEAMHQVHLLPDGVYKLDASETFNWNIYFGIFDNLSKIEHRAEVNAGLALVAFLVNTFAYIFAMNFHPRLGVVNSILGAAFSDLIAFTLVIGIFVALTAMMGYTVFGRAWREFSTYPDALQTVASAAMGDYEKLIYDLDPVVPAFMVTLFFVFVWFIRLLGTVLLINILISIFAKTYDDRKDSQQFNTVRLFWSCVVAVYFWLFSCCCPARHNRMMWRQAVSANERLRRESITRMRLESLGHRPDQGGSMRDNFPTPAHASSSNNSQNQQHQNSIFSSSNPTLLAMRKTAGAAWGVNSASSLYTAEEGSSNNLLAARRTKAESGETPPPPLEQYNSDLAMI